MPTHWRLQTNAATRTAIWVLAAFVCAVGPGAAPASAQAYPTKPIKLIVPYTPGSPVDVLGRVVMQGVSARSILIRKEK